MVPGGHGHLDQFGHVTGELWLHGERLGVDCIEMRDRTWSPRRESRQGAMVTYSYGAADRPTRAFTSRPATARAGGAPRCSPASCSRTALRVHSSGGRCEVTRDERGRPVAVRVAATREDGTPLSKRTARW